MPLSYTEDPDRVARLSALAEQRGWTISALLRHLVDAGLSTLDPNPQEANG